MQHFAWFIFYVTPPGLQMVIDVCFIFMHNKLCILTTKVYIMCQMWPLS